MIAEIRVLAPGHHLRAGYSCSSGRRRWRDLAYVCVETWDLGVNQVQRTKPVVKQNGALLPFTYILPSKYGEPLIAA